MLEHIYWWSVFDAHGILWELSLGIAIRIRYDSEFGSFDSLSKIRLWIKPIRNSFQIRFKTVSDSEICNHNLLFHCVLWLTLERPRFILSALILKIMYWRTVHTIRLNSFEIRKTVSNSEVCLTHLKFESHSVVTRFGKGFLNSKMNSLNSKKIWNWYYSCNPYSTASKRYIDLKGP